MKTTTPPAGAQGTTAVGRGKLGTFGGVFTPSILTILGIILFLRVGFVVGSAGLTRALAIILIANAISLLTSISLAAIATNMRVKGGGDYYLISRTLGVEYGGALGLVLFLAQSVSVGFYAIGFGEALGDALGMAPGLFARTVAAAAVASLFVLAWLGADWATRFQYVVMSVLAAGILAFFAGGLPGLDATMLRSNLEPTPVVGPDGGISQLPFWAIFALFFPAVTGFTQGVSMSGDLRDPGRSLPRGTFAAVWLSLLVYVAVAIVLAGTVPSSELVGSFGAMRKVALVPLLVDAGVIAATLSSALASFLGAPRILQSLAGDRIFPFLLPFAHGSGPARNPRRGVVLTGAIALGTIALGNLNAIAPVVSMFFLISYGLLNYATFVEARAKSPSFRPRFRLFDARLSLLGALGCLGGMLAIHPTAGAIAGALVFAVHQYVSRTVSVERWADSARSQLFQHVRQDLLGIAREPEHPRYWRPVLLAFSDHRERRRRILQFATWLEGGSGLTTLVHLAAGEEPGAGRRRQALEEELREEVRRFGLPAFVRAVVSSDPRIAVPTLLQSYGLGPLRPNTALLNWFDRRDVPDGEAGLRNYGEYLRVALRFGCNVVILAAGEVDFERVEATPSRERTIDVWHRDNASGRLMLLLAYLTTRTEIWSDASIRLLASMPEEGEERKTAMERLEEMLRDARIEAEVVPVPRIDPQTILEHSAETSMVFLPMRLEDDQPKSPFGGDLDELAGGLGIVALTLAAEDITLDAEPEAGAVGEAAVSKAERTARRAEKDARKSETAAAKAEEQVEEARQAGEVSETLAALESERDRLKEKAEKAKRRAAKAQARAETAREEAKSRPEAQAGGADAEDS